MSCFSQFTPQTVKVPVMTGDAMSSFSRGDRDMISLLAGPLNGCLQRDVIIVSGASSFVFGDGLLFLKRLFFP